MQKFNCKECAEEKDINEAKKGTVSLSIPHRGLCKKCHSAKTYQDVLKIKLSLFPKSVMECDDCDRLFGTRVKNNTNRFNTCCPYCGSEEIKRGDEL